MINHTNNFDKEINFESDKRAEEAGVQGATEDGKTREATSHHVRQKDDNTLA